MKLNLERKGYDFWKCGLHCGVPVVHFFVVGQSFDFFSKGNHFGLLTDYLEGKNAYQIVFYTHVILCFTEISLTAIPLIKFAITSVTKNMKPKNKM